MKKFSLILLGCFAALLLGSCNKKSHGPIPELTSVLPEKVAPFNYIQIKGKNFGEDSNVVVVKVGGKKVELLTINDSLINARIPVGTVTGTVSVTVNEETGLSPKSLTVLKGYWMLKKELFHPDVLTRFESIAFTIGSIGYYGTGYDGGTTWGDLYSYDPATNTTTKLASCPRSLQGAAVMLINNKAYLIAGRSSQLPTDNGREVWCYDPSSNTWTKKGNFPGEPRFMGNAFVVGSKGYFGTGQAINSSVPFDTSDWWEYDATNDSWTKKTNVPVNQFLQAPGFVINNKIYIGACAYGYVNDWYVYDPAIDKWTKLKDSPAAGGFGATGFVLGSTGYICGNSLHYMWSYDAATDTWGEHGFISSVYAGSSLVINGKAYYISGTYEKAKVWEYVQE